MSQQRQHCEHIWHRMLTGHRLVMHQIPGIDERSTLPHVNSTDASEYKPTMTVGWGMGVLDTMGHKLDGIRYY